MSTNPTRLPLDLDSLARAAGLGLVVLDGRGRILEVDRQVRAVVGIERPRPTLAALLRALFPERACRVRAVRALRGALEGRSSDGEIEAGGGFSARVAPFPATGTAAAGELGREDRGAVVVLSTPRGAGASGEQLQRYAASLERIVDDRTRELARSEAKYRELFDASPDIYLTIGQSGRIEEVNLTALRLTGRRRDEVVGRQFVRLLTGPARRSALAARPAFLDHGSIENLELQVLRRSRHPLDVIANVEAVHDGEGRIVGARAILRDITDRVVLERQISHVDRLAATGQLAAGVAHEINNPLQAVLVHMSLVEDQLAPDFPERGSWDRVKEGVRRIQQIVADLLDLHRGSEREVGPVDVNRVAGEAFGLVQVPLRHRSITAQADFGEGLPPVRAVARHVYQVVLNLLLNAMDAMPNGGTLGLRTRRALGSNGVEIDISDSGPGISSDVLAHIFDPFASPGRRGTGLGLFVTYGLVRRHGGRIQVDSTPGRGSQFRVIFPVDEAHD